MVQQKPRVQGNNTWIPACVDRRQQSGCLDSHQDEEVLTLTSHFWFSSLSLCFSGSLRVRELLWYDVGHGGRRVFTKVKVRSCRPHNRGLQGNATANTKKTKKKGKKLLR